MASSRSGNCAGKMPKVRTTRRPPWSSGVEVPKAVRAEEQGKVTKTQARRVFWPPQELRSGSERGLPLPGLPYPSCFSVAPLSSSSSLSILPIFPSSCPLPRDCVWDENSREHGLGPAGSGQYCIIWAACFSFPPHWPFSFSEFSCWPFSLLSEFSSYFFLPHMH